MQVLMMLPGVTSRGCSCNEASFNSHFAGALHLGQQGSLLVHFSYSRDADKNVQRTYSICPDMDFDKLIFTAIGSSSRAVSPGTTLTQASDMEVTDLAKSTSRDLVLSQIRNVSKRHSSFSLGNLPIPLEEGIRPTFISVR